MNENTILDSPGLLSKRATTIWRVVQVLVWALGFGIFVLLVVAPELGLHAFWNILIPVAPALLVVAVGLWRNICPLGSTARLPQYLGLDTKKKLSLRGQSFLAVLGVVLLFALVPLRHVIWDINGLATAALLAVLTIVALVLSTIYERKSGWCAGLCPIHAVEKLYGGKPVLQVANLHCQPGCRNCVSVCPDSRSTMHPLQGKVDHGRRMAGLVMVGAFPGFVWGWFHVPNYLAGEGWSQLHVVYGLPFLAAACTLAAYVMIRKTIRENGKQALIFFFAAAAVACYYWYRLPALFGYGLFPGDGMLIDLTAIITPAMIAVSRIATTLFFLWFVFLRSEVVRAWSTRPPVQILAAVERPAA